MSECITLDCTNLDSDTIKEWFSEHGFNYDSETGVMSNGEDVFYMSIYSKVDNIFLREWGNQDFPDIIFDFIYAFNNISVVSLLTVDEDGYPDPDSAVEYAYQDFIDMLNEDGEE